MKSLLFVLILAATAVNGLAQGEWINGEFKVTGAVQDKSGAVIPGLNLYVDKDGDNRAFPTDINGEFEMRLRPGDFVVTVSKTNSADFKAFLRIQEGNLNPNNLVFVLDLETVCCTTSSGIRFPKPTSLPKPPYPPAARAVRAVGEVVVSVKIDNDGKVQAAVAESGHPLLRAAAAAAAKGARFESTEITAEREAKLTYVFMTDSTEKPGLKRVEFPYRILVIGDPVSIES